MLLRYLTVLLVFNAPLVAAPKYSRLSIHADDQVRTPHRWDGGLSDDAPDRQVLLADSAFSEGFGAAFIYGIREADDTVRSYRDIALWQVHLIPEGPVKKLAAFKTHSWDFQEGLHHNYTNQRGEKIRELHAHRLVVNHVIEVNTPDKLQFAQFNNDGLAKGDPQRDTKVVQRITTDRHGTLRLFYNSQNEIRNAATAHTARWARDTWPHLLVNQRFENPIAVNEYERLDFGVSFQVDRMQRLSPWPGLNRSSMNLNFMFYLKHREDPTQKLFVGMMLCISNEAKYVLHLGVEQHGMVFYRESVTRDQPKPEFGQTRSVTREMKAMIQDALTLAQAKQPKLSTDPNDFRLSNFSIGGNAGVRPCVRSWRVIGSGTRWCPHASRGDPMPRLPQGQPRQARTSHCPACAATARES